MDVDSRLLMEDDGCDGIFHRKETIKIARNVLRFLFFFLVFFSLVNCLIEVVCLISVWVLVVAGLVTFLTLYLQVAGCRKVYVAFYEHLLQCLKPKLRAIYLGFFRGYYINISIYQLPWVSYITIVWTYELFKWPYNIKEIREPFSWTSIVHLNIESFNLAANDTVWKQNFLTHLRLPTKKVGNFKHIIL